jgi:hypothetical protein
MASVMGKCTLVMLAVASLFALAGCRSAAEGLPPDGKVILWNGVDFTGWHRFIGDPAVKVDDVWRIRGGTLYCGGQANGYIRTEKEYRNYRLHVEWFWPAQAGNSGILLHAGEPDRIWPTCIECQLKAGSAGDFVLMNGAGLVVDGVERRHAAQQFVVIPKKSPVGEKPVGQWNSCDIYCNRGSIRCFVNGILQNEGSGATPDAGHICLQSEGTPIQFRNIYLLPIE